MTSPAPFRGTRSPYLILDITEPKTEEYENTSTRSTDLDFDVFVVTGKKAKNWFTSHAGPEQSEIHEHAKRGHQPSYANQQDRRTTVLLVYLGQSPVSYCNQAAEKRGMSLYSWVRAM